MISVSTHRPRRLIDRLAGSDVTKYCNVPSPATSNVVAVRRGGDYRAG